MDSLIAIFLGTNSSVVTTGLPESASTETSSIVEQRPVKRQSVGPRRLNWTSALHSNQDVLRVGLHTADLDTRVLRTTTPFPGTPPSRVAGQKGRLSRTSGPAAQYRGSRSSSRATFAAGADEARLEREAVHRLDRPHDIRPRGPLRWSADRVAVRRRCP